VNSQDAAAFVDLDETSEQAQPDISTVMRFFHAGYPEANATLELKTYISLPLARNG
jgi:hypothetical protein